MSNQKPVTYLHCATCLDEMPDGISPMEYARTQVGINKDGLFEVWCNRHDISVAVLTEDLREKLSGAKCEQCGKEHYHHH